MSIGSYRAAPPRGMILNSDLPNPLDVSEKQQLGKGVYTPVYTNDSELQFIVDSWRKLSGEIRNVIVQLVKIMVKDN